VLFTLQPAKMSGRPFGPIPSTQPWRLHMSKTPVRTTIDANGLRYHSKASGSPFASTGVFSAATMSCFFCGKHRPRSALKSRKLLGKTQFVCAPSCKEADAPKGA
jgi:hypothetical protein